MRKGNLFDTFFEDRAIIESECDLSEAHLIISHDEIRKINSVTGFCSERETKAKSVTIEGLNGKERLRVSITGDFRVTVECIEKII